MKVVISMLCFLTIIILMDIFYYDNSKRIIQEGLFKCRYNYADCLKECSTEKSRLDYLSLNNDLRYVDQLVGFKEIKCDETCLGSFNSCKRGVFRKK